MKLNGIDRETITKIKKLNDYKERKQVGIRKLNTLQKKLP